MTPAPVGIRCPEHSGKPQGLRKVTATAQRAATGTGSNRINAVTVALIVANVAVAALELASGSATSLTNNTIFERGALFAPAFYHEGYGVANGEWWRLFSSMFLHVNFFHLLTNMYSLYFAGSILEQVIGRWRFLLLYVASGLAGGAGALIDKPLTPTVGASGAIFGILGALFVLERRGTLATGGQIGGLIVLNLVITFVFRDFISVGGHVGGLIGGVALMSVMLQFRRSWAVGLGAGLALAIVSIVVAYSKAKGYAS